MHDESCMRPWGERGVQKSASVDPATFPAHSHHHRFLMQGRAFVLI